MDSWNRRGPTSNIRDKKRNGQKEEEEREREEGRLGKSEKGKGGARGGGERGGREGGRKSLTSVVSRLSALFYSYVVVRRHDRLQKSWRENAIPIGAKMRLIRSLLWA